MTQRLNNSARTTGLDPFILLMLLYFSVQVVVRLAVSPALELDEAEQALWTQRLALGYGAQPPLYTWLQWTVFQVTGVSLLGLSLLKNGLLFLTYIATYGAAKQLLPRHLAALAAASLLLIPAIGWESQRDLTHTVLATSMAACLLYVIMRLLVEGPRPMWYLALGVAVGLGILAKYSFVMVVAAWLVAMLCWAPGRRLVLSPWIVLSAMVAMAIVIPHALWLLDHWQMASEGTLNKMRGSSDAVLPWWQQTTQGFAALVQALLGSVILLLIVFAAVFGLDSWRRGSLPRHSLATGIAGQLAAVILILVLILLVSDATQVKSRWLTPVLVPVPLLLLVWVQHGASAPRAAWLRSMLIVMGVLYLTAMALRPWFDAFRDRPDELNEPVVALTQALRAMGVPPHAHLMAQTNALAGSLRLQFPQASVQSLNGNHSQLDTTRDTMSVRLSRSLPSAAELNSCQTYRTLELPYLLAASGAKPLTYHICIWQPLTR